MQSFAADKLLGSGSSGGHGQHSAQAVEGQPCGGHADQRRERARESIVCYFLERSAEFRELTDLRQKGWNSPEGDAFFRRQRQNADADDERTAMYFFQLMKKIGQEMHQAVDAFAALQAPARPLAILDMCMAPGGFLATALSRNPGSRGLSFSLPVSDGGYKVFLPREANVEQRFLDITMLAADMGVAGEIPRDHPDAGNFLPRQLGPGQQFDLVLCDGQVLRTHSRAAYRERREARRLTTTQLALGLEHLRPGGTMVILLHKFEAWDTVDLLWTFHQFSSVRLHKPKAGHAKRSSFYLVAADIHSQHPEAVRAIRRWKAAWRAATFDPEEEYREALSSDEPSVEELLECFGPELVELGRDIWKVQAEALAKAPFIRKAAKESPQPPVAGEESLAGSMLLHG